MCILSLLTALAFANPPSMREEIGRDGMKKLMGLVVEGQTVTVIYESVETYELTLLPNGNVEVTHSFYRWTGQQFTGTFLTEVTVDQRWKVIGVRYGSVAYPKNGDLGGVTTWDEPCNNSDPLLEYFGGTCKSEAEAELSWLAALWKYNGPYELLKNPEPFK